MILDYEVNRLKSKLEKNSPKKRRPKEDIESLENFYRQQKEDRLVKDRTDDIRRDREFVRCIKKSKSLLRMKKMHEKRKKLEEEQEQDMKDTLQMIYQRQQTAEYNKQMIERAKELHKQKQKKLRRLRHLIALRKREQERLAKLEAMDCEEDDFYYTDEGFKVKKKVNVEKVRLKNNARRRRVRHKKSLYSMIDLRNRSRIKDEIDEKVSRARRAKEQLYESKKKYLKEKNLMKRLNHQSRYNTLSKNSVSRDF